MRLQIWIALGLVVRFAICLIVWIELYYMDGKLGVRKACVVDKQMHCDVVALREGMKYGFNALCRGVNAFRQSYGA